MRNLLENITISVAMLISSKGYDFAIHDGKAIYITSSKK
jgi:hypothetical protein